MAKYSIVIDTDGDPDDDAGLQKVVADYNLAAAAAEQPTLTIEEYLTFSFAAVIKSYANSFRESEGKIISVKFGKADSITRNVVKAALADIAVEPDAPANAETPQ